MDRKKERPHHRKDVSQHSWWYAFGSQLRQPFNVKHLQNSPIQFHSSVFIYRLLQSELSERALYKPKAWPPVNTSGKENVPFDRKKR